MKYEKILKKVEREGSCLLNLESTKSSDVQVCYVKEFQCWIIGSYEGLGSYGYEEFERIKDANDYLQKIGLKFKNIKS